MHRDVHREGRKPTKGLQSGEDQQRHLHATSLDHAVSEKRHRGHGSPSCHSDGADPRHVMDSPNFQCMQTKYTEEHGRDEQDAELWLVDAFVLLRQPYCA
ncbi:hypothetical protein LshimejAT787_1401240 [Lyophyllum shimeji]|uniref:Uncharacterized protein n=1 Tax=Lyophyllum shimeji TaxID=47721 RepID=A0A9P3PVD0_LYOSH|nr:hypothetical protein LshimejAT787_1401240 [Lyophyllum shimeji]